MMKVLHKEPKTSIVIDGLQRVENSHFEFWLSGSISVISAILALRPILMYMWRIVVNTNSPVCPTLTHGQGPKSRVSGQRPGPGYFPSSNVQTCPCVRQLCTRCDYSQTTVGISRHRGIIISQISQHLWHITKILLQKSELKIEEKF